MPRLFFFVKAQNQFTGTPVYVSEETPTEPCKVMALSVSNADYANFRHSKTNGTALYIGRCWKPQGVMTGLFHTQKDAISAVLRRARQWRRNAPSKDDMLEYAKQVMARPDEAVSLSQTRGYTVPNTTALDDEFITVMRVRPV